MPPPVVHSEPEILDVVVVGGGPAGIACAQTFAKEGLKCVIFEQGAVAHHIAQYPTFMRFFSTNDNLEIDGFPLLAEDEKPTRYEYLNYLTRFAQYHQLRVETHTKVVAVNTAADGLFNIMVERPGRAARAVGARNVVLAVGAWESPRRLEVPGAELPKVQTRYTEAHEYVGKEVLVVGGRNSAVETALQLWRAGAKVSLCYRGTEFNGRGLKYWLKPDIENRIANGEIRGYLGSRVSRITWDSVDITNAGGSVQTIPNDFVLTMLGYNPPVAMLKAFGVDIEPGTNKPFHDPETLETTVQGLFVAGTITAGNVSGSVFIENSRHHGELILAALR